MIVYFRLLRDNCSIEEQSIQVDNERKPIYSFLQIPYREQTFRHLYFSDSNSYTVIDIHSDGQLRFKYTGLVFSDFFYLTKKVQPRTATAESG